MKAITRMKRTIQRQLSDITELQRKMARCEEDCRLIARQRDEFQRNATDYRNALVTIMSAMQTTLNGAQVVVDAADEAATKRMHERYQNQEMTATPERDR